MKRVNNLLMAVLILAAALAGCKKQGQPPAPAPNPAEHPKPAGPPVQKQISSATAQQGSTLDFHNRKDPFRPYVEAPVTPAVRPAQIIGPSGAQLPIQSYDTTKFKVEGIITGLDHNRALIVDPAGKGYVVEPGMALGNNNGRITRITPSSVVVFERFRDPNGHLRSRKVVLTLAKKR